MSWAGPGEKPMLALAPLSPNIPNQTGRPGRCAMLVKAIKSIRGQPENRIHTILTKGTQCSKVVLNVGFPDQQHLPHLGT